MNPFAINYSMNGGIGGWIELQVSYDSHSKQLVLYHRPDILNLIKKDPVYLKSLPPRFKIRKLTDEEEEDLKQKIVQTGYFQPNEEPRSGPSDNRRIFYFITNYPGRKNKKCYMVCRNRRLTSRS